MRVDGATKNSERKRSFDQTPTFGCTSLDMAYSNRISTKEAFKPKCTNRHAFSGLSKELHVPIQSFSELICRLFIRPCDVAHRNSTRSIRRSLQSPFLGTMLTYPKVLILQSSLCPSTFKHRPTSTAKHQLSASFLWSRMIQIANQFTTKHKRAREDLEQRLNRNGKEKNKTHTTPLILHPNRDRRFRKFLFRLLLSLQTISLRDGLAPRPCLPITLPLLSLGTCLPLFLLLSRYAARLYLAVLGLAVTLGFDVFALLASGFGVHVLWVVGVFVV